MRLLLFWLSFLLSFLCVAQEVKIGAIENKIVIGNLTGNRDITFGVQNVLEEVIQDYGYDLNPNSNTEITVDLLFFDVQKNNVQLAIYQKGIDVYKIVARATLYIDGKKKRIATAQGEAKSISTATLIIDEGGKFSQANVSTAIKKLCEQLVEKLKI